MAVIRVFAVECSNDCTVDRPAQSVRRPVNRVRVPVAYTEARSANVVERPVRNSEAVCVTFWLTKPVPVRLNVLIRACSEFPVNLIFRSKSSPEERQQPEIEDEQRVASR